MVAHDDPEEARSVGVGMTPGDGGYPEPYFYVTPWPYPNPEVLPRLATGSWHTEGWTGAVLTGTEALAGEVEERTRAFLAEAVEACMATL